MNQIQNLIFCIFHHLLSRNVRISRCRTSKKQTKIVVDFSRSTHSRARIFIRRFLFDGNNRTQSRNLIHIRTFHTPQEISGIGRKCLNISALSFGKKRVECQRRLTTSTQTGNNGKAVARNFHIYIFEVVHTCSLYTNHFFSFHHILIIAQ